MLPPVDKPSSFRDLGPINVETLIKLADNLPENIWAFADERKENKFAVFHDTQHIIFRFTRGNIDPRDSYDTPFWTSWSKHLLPLMESISANLSIKKPTFSKAMLARLKAGGRIEKHSDGAGSNLSSHKIHVPLISNPNVRFHIGDKTCHLEVGRAYEVNNIVKHGVDNLGDEDRIHFIFEVYDAALPLIEQT